MQLLFERSEEGEVECLGLLPGVVRRLHPAIGVRAPKIPRKLPKVLDADEMTAVLEKFAGYGQQ